MILNILFIIIGFALLIKGADFLVDGSSQIAKKFHISEMIIGLTIVSIGTSLPELIVSLTSALKDFSDMAIGNVIGSNISNLFLILGICTIIKPLKFKDETVEFEIPFLILLTGLLYIFGNNGAIKMITQLEGATLLFFCVLFIVYNIKMAGKSSSDALNLEDNKNISIIKSFIYIVIGITILKFGGDFVVDNASYIAKTLGISEKIVSLTIVSISTSLPELITSVTAVFKGEIDMGIGNVIGSNIFNIVLIVGITAFAKPIYYSISYNKDIIIFLLGMIVLGIIPYIGQKNRISRISGIGFVCCYLSYMVSLVMVNMG